MRVAHLSDLHYGERHLQEVHRCAQFAVDRIIEIATQGEGIDLIVLSGDTFDHLLEQNSPALMAAMETVYSLSSVAPTVILQGTYSHDAPRAIEMWMRLGSDFPVLVADHIGQYGLTRKGVFFPWDHGLELDGIKAIISVLPAINKAHVAAAVGAEAAGEATGDHVARLLASWAATHVAARVVGIPSMVISHGTVSGAVTEQGVPMMGLDHEYTTGALFAAQASAVLLGHIHKHQAWIQDGRVIAYPGSIGRLHFGEHDPKGFLLWDLGASTTFEFVPTPARQLVDIEFMGAPDMDELERLSMTISPGTHLRIRYVVDEEHGASVDHILIERLFAKAAQIKIEARIVPIQRQRAAGIGQAISLRERLVMWCEVTGTEAPPLLERLAALEAQAAEDLIEDLP